MEKVNFSDLFKKEKRQDTVQVFIEDMYKLSEACEYEKANEILIKIKEELEKPASDIWPYSYVALGDIQTIKDVYDLIKSSPIRLYPDNYNFSDFLNLVIAVHNRLDELKGRRYIDIDRQRKIVAEEMFKLKIVVPAQYNRKVGTTPNRRFLEIAYEINPGICSKELGRREGVKLWKAVESGKQKNIEQAKKGLRQYSDKVDILKTRRE